MRVKVKESGEIIDVVECYSKLNTQTYQDINTGIIYTVYDLCFPIYK